MTKKHKITYWFATIVLASGLIASGIQQLLGVEAVGALAPPYAWGIVRCTAVCTKHMETHGNMTLFMHRDQLETGHYYNQQYYIQYHWNIQPNNRHINMYN